MNRLWQRAGNEIVEVVDQVYLLGKNLAIQGAIDHLPFVLAYCSTHNF